MDGRIEGWEFNFTFALVRPNRQAGIMVMRSMALVARMKLPFYIATPVIKPDFPKSKMALLDLKPFSAMFPIHAMLNFLKIYRTFGHADFGKSGLNLGLEVRSSGCLPLSYGPSPQLVRRLDKDHTPDQTTSPDSHLCSYSPPYRHHRTKWLSTMQSYND